MPLPRSAGTRRSTRSSASSGLAIRDVILAEYVNRLYWELYPDAPIKIDPGDPAHDRYEKGWLELRDQIMSNAPQPPINDGELDLSRVRADAFELMAYSLPQIREELYQDLRATVETMIDTYRTALRDGRVAPDDHWKSDLVEIASNEDPQHKVQLRMFAFLYEGMYQGGLDVFEVVKPLPA